MESIAKARFIRQSPKKVGQVLELVRGKKVEQALNILHFTPKVAAPVIEKTVRSAISNFLQVKENSGKDPANLMIKRAFVDAGPTLKRVRAASMGRASRILRRTSHITIIVDEA